MRKEPSDGPAGKEQGNNRYMYVHVLEYRYVHLPVHCLTPLPMAAAMLLLSSLDCGELAVRGLFRER